MIADGRIGRQDDVAIAVTEVTAEPAPTGTREAHLGAVDELARHAAVSDLPKDHLGATPWILRRDGSRATNSISSWSSSGARASSEFAIVARSIFTSRSSGR